jgi:SAM-dependent methyltransferase
MTTQDEIRQFYDSFSRTLIRDFSFLNLRQDAIRRACRQLVPRGARVLEIGCGGGSITKSLQKRASRVVSLDISPQNIAIARQFASAPNTEFVTLDILEKPAVLDQYGDFDVVLLADVVEHIPIARYDRLFSAIEKRLSPDGIVLMTYPTPEHQAWLREHEPDVLQVVDERVELDTLLRATELAPVKFQYMDIWRRNDYVHLVLSADRSYTPARIRRSLFETLGHRIRKYRWRFGNFLFLQRLKNTMAQGGSVTPARPAIEPHTVASESGAYASPANLHETHPGKR